MKKAELKNPAFLSAWSRSSAFVPCRKHTTCGPVRNLERPPLPRCSSIRCCRARIVLVTLDWSRRQVDRNAAIMGRPPQITETAPHVAGCCHDLQLVQFAFFRPSYRHYRKAIRGGYARGVDFLDDTRGAGQVRRYVPVRKNRSTGPTAGTLQRKGCDVRIRTCTRWLTETKRHNANIRLNVHRSPPKELVKKLVVFYN